MNKNKLEEIKKRADAASPGPWKSFREGRDHSSGDSFISIADGNELDDEIYPICSEETQDFMAHARQDIPALLNEIKGSENPMAKNEINRIRERANAASPAPWKSHRGSKDISNDDNYIIDGNGKKISMSYSLPEDQEFITHARHDIPILLDEIERLRRRST